MNRLNPWAFGIIFLIVSFFILTTDSNVELLFSGKKKNTKAIITKTKISYGLKGRGYVQYLNFYFITGGELIYGYKKTKIKEPWQYIGNSINIEYSEKKPLVNKILEFNNEYGSSNMESFLNVKKDGYSQISFNNGVFFYENSNGVELKKIVGTFEKFKDSIFLYDFFGKKNKLKFIKKEKGIINLLNMELYK
jgi:hypothetical protein|tara:strand:- start:56 stop:634 length:579 start_codon:yes stop_codon:yes gene_type:complete